MAQVERSVRVREDEGGGRRMGTRTAIHQEDTGVWGDVSEDRLTSAPDTIKSLLNIPS